MMSDADVSTHHGDDNVGGGKLLIMRYKQSKIIHNAAIATANALQEPGTIQTPCYPDAGMAKPQSGCQTSLIPSIACQSKESVNVVFPVILKRDHYYIIIGEERTPVYRVLNPKELFFTSGGRRLFIDLLSKNYRGEGEHLDFYENREGTRETYCVPEFLGTPMFGAEFSPTNRWDNCNNSLIAKQLVIPVVQEQVVPPFFWQVLFTKLSTSMIL
eukprot:scaffold4664_cov80-Skeletonema_marinoi.AAC.3